MSSGRISIHFFDCIHGARLGAFLAVAALFLVYAEFSLSTDYHSVKRTFNVTCCTADALVLIYIVCHFIFPPLSSYA